MAIYRRLNSERAPHPCNDFFRRQRGIDGAIGCVAGHEELERAVDERYEPGEGARGPAREQLELAGALLTAFVLTDRLPYSMLAEEIVLWMSQNVGFIDLADRFCTGSSIMPQKKNPDVPELIRGKTGRVNGHLVALLTLMKGQPLAYNKDNQEDKESLFDTVDTILVCLRVTAAMLPTIVFDGARGAEEAVAHFALATDVADYLAKKGIVPGIKVDTGAKPLAGPTAKIETVTEGLDGLRFIRGIRPRSQRAAQQPARGDGHNGEGKDSLELRGHVQKPRAVPA